MHSFIPTFTFTEADTDSRIVLSHSIASGVPGWDSNPGLPCCRPTKYYLSYAAILRCGVSICCWEVTKKLN
jgi:hypothetical protein